MTITREYTAVTCTPFYYAKQGEYVGADDTRVGAIRQVIDKVICNHDYRNSPVNGWEYCRHCQHNRRKA